MDAMVSARVPVEVKKQGDRKLKEIGSSATELVNAAYSYLIETGELPMKRSLQVASNPQVKTLSGEAATTFRNRWASREKLETPGYDGDNFKQQLNQARGEYYARFA